MMDRVIYPVTGFTRGDAIDYYRRIAPVLLPHLHNRPVTLKRYPDQAQGEFFYEKDAPGFTPDWVKTFAVWRRSGESQIHYILINDRRTLEWAASVGTLEIHPFLARSEDFDSPTQIVFDLDPGEGADILDCARVAFLLRDLLGRLEIQSFAKVSGSKGLQVYVPLNTSTKYAATQPFARTVAETLAKERPKEITATMEKAQRKNKVFIDWSQNADYKTTVAVYSLRAKRRHPYVSAPVAWAELEKAVAERNPESLFFFPDAVIDRSKKLGDLFAPVETLKQKLPQPFVGTAAAKTRKVEPRARRRTTEPRASEQGGRRTFAIVRDGKQLKLILQVHETSRAWAMSQIPSRVGQSVTCTPTAPPESGSKMEPAWDRGTVELIEGNPAKGYLDLWFTGERLHGEYILRSSGEWEFIKPKANASYAPEAFLRPATRRERIGPSHSSVPNRSDATVHLPRDLAASEPRFVIPMECKLVDDVPSGAGWLYELKLDGYRIIGVRRGERADIYSRRGTSFADRFPQIIRMFHTLPLPDCVLDGEIVALDEQGRPSFQELQNSRTTRQPIVYYVFDLLNVNGRNLLALPISQRKRLLAEVAEKFSEPIRLAEILNADAETLVQQVKRLGLEGVVAKRADSRYEPGKRSGAWVKYRVNEREDLLIGGYLPGRTGLDALLTGRRRAGNLYFVKKVRNGFVPASRRQLLTALKPLRTPKCPFTNLPEPSSRRGAVDTEEMKVCVWVRPERHAEIEYAEQTAGGRLRHASFRALVD